MIRTVLPPLCLLLCACQQANPYTAQGVPYPAAPAAAATHFDSSAYPAPARDYALYRSWAWRNQQLPAGSGWASSQLLADSLAGLLDQRGLRPAQGSTPGDLQVSTQLELAEVEWVQPPDAGVGYGQGPYGSGYGAWGSRPIGGSYQQQVIRVRIDFYDGRSGQLIWSGNAAKASGDDSDQRAADLREVLQQALASYPPE